MRSLPVRGAWVEILQIPCKSILMWSLPVRGAWVEIKRGCKRALQKLVSLPVRGAWVEIYNKKTIVIPHYVAPRAGSVG